MNKEYFDQSWTADANSGCWLWNRGFFTQGYGATYYPDWHSPIKAHRAAWIFYRGPIPEDMWVLHKCDNRACVNPDHLFLGSARDNNYDAISKGRQPRSRLGEKLAREIKARCGSITLLSREYGVSRQTIWHIRTGRTWKNI